MQGLRKFIGLLVISSWLLATPVQALPEIKPSFPRTANYFLHWTISEAEARELAKFDLIILDAEIQERSRAELQLLRKLNPQAIILAYVPIAEVRRDVGNLQTIAPVRYKFGAPIPESWYLKDTRLARMSFWPGTWIVNITGPWQTYLAELVVQEILKTGLWDGVMYDNAWDDIIHFARGIPDLNSDGIPDDAEEARKAWQIGVRAIYQATIALASDKLVLENDGPMYAREVHGVMLENFPRKGFTRHFSDLQAVHQQSQAPAVAILNATSFNTGIRDDYRAVRFGLTTALLSGAFYSFDFGDQDHGQTWQYDEYSAFLGEPISSARYSGQVTNRGNPAIGLWRRDFEKGVVLVNPTDNPITINLPIKVEHLRGIQDPVVNDGSVTRELRVPARDGLIVLRPLQVIEGAPFENGVFARVFDVNGLALRADFFALDRQVRTGAMLTRVDLDGDGKAEKFFKDKPFAIGDLTGDGVKEIVIGEGGAVRIYNKDGIMLALPFYPFGPRYKKDISVAAGDLNGDGLSEIVVGAGPGGGPQVRIFSREGKLLSGGFFAYDPRFRGGVRVAVGDVDNDGHAEIVTGPGAGGGPQIRIFSTGGKDLGKASFSVVGSFFAFDRATRKGVTPIVTDIDGDRNNEIVAVVRE